MRFRLLRTRHIGILVNELENDPEVVSRLAALRQALQELGWTFGENLRVDMRYGTDNVNLKEKAKELVLTAEFGFGAKWLELLTERRSKGCHYY